MQFVLRRRKSVNGGGPIPYNTSLSIPNSNSNNNTFSNTQSNSPPKTSTVNTYRSPVLNKANKLAKKIGRSKTQQVIAQPQYNSRNFDDLPPHYPNYNKWAVFRCCFTPITFYYYAEDNKNNQRTKTYRCLLFPNMILLFVECVF